MNRGAFRDARTRLIEFPSREKSLLERAKARIVVVDQLIEEVRRVERR